MGGILNERPTQNHALNYGFLQIRDKMEERSADSLYATEPEKQLCRSRVRGLNPSDQGIQDPLSDPAEMSQEPAV